MLLPGRHGMSDSYRYGFNGMEGDDEVKGDGNSYTTEFRQYDPRIGRWLSLDPLAGSFPWQSPFAGLDNSPIGKTDKKGDKSDWHYEEDGDGNTMLVADKGDTYQTFINQFGIGNQNANAYLSYFINNNICPGCTDQKPDGLTMSPESAPLNVNSKFKEGESFKVSSFGILKNYLDGSGIKQLAFAFRNSKKNGDKYFKLSDYLGYVPSQLNGDHPDRTWKGEIKIDGKNIKVELDIQWHDLGGETGYGTLQNNVESSVTTDMNRGEGIVEKHILVGRVNKRPGAAGRAIEGVEWFVDPKDADALYDFLNSKDLQSIDTK